jgi:hypothetical protein
LYGMIIMIDVNCVHVYGSQRLQLLFEIVSKHSEPVLVTEHHVCCSNSLMHSDW